MVDLSVKPALGTYAHLRNLGNPPSISVHEDVPLAAAFNSGDVAILLLF